MSGRIHLFTYGFNLLELIRDKMITEQGNLQLFFQNDWTPVSLRKKSREEREANFGLDHVSFGHDYETAFLMLEASYALQLKNDIHTLKIAKKMLDHANQSGWDEQVGGFYDGGYYLPGDNYCTIVKGTKNWWAQAEALNALLLFSKIFPQEARYSQYFVRQWEYVQSYVIDEQGGDWFEGGLDKEPHFKTGSKKPYVEMHVPHRPGSYELHHDLEGDSNKKINKLIVHWRKTASHLNDHKKPADNNNNIRQLSEI